MSTGLIDETKLKDALKSAIVEILEERKDLVREVLEEAFEDIALARAIEEGDQSGLVPREEVFSALERRNRRLLSGKVFLEICARHQREERTTPYRRSH